MAVISAVQEPEPGWVAGWTGLVVITAAAGKGMSMCWWCDPTNVLDIVPVDYVANISIAAAWDTHKRRYIGF